MSRRSARGNNENVIDDSIISSPMSASSGSRRRLRKRVADSDDDDAESSPPEAVIVVNKEKDDAEPNRRALLDRLASKRRRHSNTVAVSDEKEEDDDDDDNDDDDDEGGFIVNDDDDNDVESPEEAEDEASEDVKPRRLKHRRRQRDSDDDDDDRGDSHFSYNALLFEEQARADEEDSRLSSFAEDDDPQMAAVDASQLTPAQRELYIDVLSLLDDGQRSRNRPGEAKFVKMLRWATGGWTNDRLDVVGDEKARSMYGLLKLDWRTFKAQLLRETFHGSFNDAFLGKHLQHPLTELFSRRQMGSDRRAQLPLLALDPERRMSIFRAVVAGEVKIDAMSPSELLYVDRAMDLFASVGAPRLSDRETFAELKQSLDMQMVIRRLTCDSCQDFVDSHAQNGTMVPLRFVVHLSARVRGCYGNFDTMEDAIESSGDDNDDIDDDEPQEVTARFRVPVGAALRSRHTLYVCIDCGSRIQCAKQMVKAVRRWIELAPALFACRLKRSEMRALCRMAAVLLMTNSDEANQVLSKSVGGVGSRIRRREDDDEVE
jgi:hypothetical protein